MGTRATITVFFVIVLGVATATIVSYAADLGALVLPGKLNNANETEGTLVGVDGWDDFTFGMSPEETLAVLERKGIVAEADEAHGMFPGAPGEPHSCRTFHHFRYKMNGWFINIDLTGYSLQEISMAAPDRYSSAQVDGLVESLKARIGKPVFEQPTVKSSHAPRAQWSANTTSLTLSTWPDGSKYGVVVRIVESR